MEHQPFAPRILALSGIAAAVLFITGTAISDVNGFVSPQAPSDAIAGTFIEHRSSIYLGTYLTLLGIFCLIWFSGYLRQYLLRYESESGWLSSVSFGGGLLTSGMLLLAAHFSQAFTVITNYSGQTQAAKALYALEWNDRLLVEAIPFAVLIAATTAIGFMRQALPVWLNWFGVILCLALLSPFLPGSGVILGFLWLLLLSMVLFFRTPTVL